MGDMQMWHLVTGSDLPQSLALKMGRTPNSMVFHWLVLLLFLKWQTNPMTLTLEGLLSETNDGKTFGNCHVLIQLMVFQISAWRGASYELVWKPIKLQIYHEISAATIVDLVITTHLFILSVSHCGSRLRVVIIMHFQMGSAHCMDVYLYIYTYYIHIIYIY